MPPIPRHGDGLAVGHHPSGPVLHLAQVVPLTPLAIVLQSRRILTIHGCVVEADGFCALEVFQTNVEEITEDVSQLRIVAESMLRLCVQNGGEAAMAGGLGKTSRNTRDSDLVAKRRPREC